MQVDRFNIVKMLIVPELILKVINLFTGAAAAIAFDTISGQDKGEQWSSDGRASEKDGKNLGVMI